MDYVDQTFEDMTVELDGNSFRNCVFRNVTLEYGGGDLTVSDCAIESFRFRFTGALANGLHAMYQLFGSEGMLQIIRGYTDPNAQPVSELKMPGRA